MKFLAHFHGTRDYFECHELLEEHWKEEEDPALKGIWHGLIQVAVALYHQRRGNLKGAVKMMDQAIVRLAAEDVGRVGLEQTRLLHILQDRVKQLTGMMDGDPIPYSDLELPVADPDLLRQAMVLGRYWGVEWNRPSPMGDLELIHRHTRRDRSDVIEERRRRLAERDKQ